MLPSQLLGKESACSAGDLGLIPGSGRSPREGNGNPLPYSCLENPVDRGTWQATVLGVARVRHNLVTTPPPPPPPISNEKSENDLKDFESPKCRKIVGKVLKILIQKFTVKAINGSRYVLSCPCSLKKVNWSQEQKLPWIWIHICQDSLFYSMFHKDTGNTSFFLRLGCIRTDYQLDRGERTTSYKPRIIPV